jgi:N6-adenosine-specific RNA methylase IME4
MMNGLVVAGRPGMLGVEKACAMLAEATRVDEVKKIRDVAVAMKAYARTQKAGKAIALDAGEIILRADARMGVLARELPKAKAGGKGGGSESPNGGLSFKGTALAAVGITKQRGADFEKVSRLPQKQLDEYIAAERRANRAPSTTGAVTLARLPDASRTKVLAKLGDLPDMRAAMNALRREERVEKLAEISKENSPLTGKLGRFPVLYADPPWRYEHVKTNSRSIENQYPTMELSEICGLKVASIATPDAILFLWATSPKLAEAMKVLEAWGFTYRTCMVWVKNKVGMGYYARQQHELLLIATIGSPPVPPESARPSSVVTRPRGEHSAKPPVFYEIIERMYPELKRIELFCRAPREGWTAWGNQS